MVHIQPLTTENMREKKKKERNHRGKIECPHLLRRVDIKNSTNPKGSLGYSSYTTLDQFNNN